MPALNNNRILLAAMVSHLFRESPSHSPYQVSGKWHQPRPLSWHPEHCLRHYCPRNMHVLSPSPLHSTTVETFYTLQMDLGRFPAIAGVLKPSSPRFQLFHTIFLLPFPCSNWVGCPGGYIRKTRRDRHSARTHDAHAHTGAIQELANDQQPPCTLPAESIHIPSMLVVFVSPTHARARTVFRAHSMDHSPFLKVFSVANHIQHRYN